MSCRGTATHVEKPLYCYGICLTVHDYANTRSIVSPSSPLLFHDNPQQPSKETGMKQPPKGVASSVTKPTIALRGPKDYIRFLLRNCAPQHRPPRKTGLKTIRGEWGGGKGKKKEKIGKKKKVARRKKNGDGGRRARISRDQVSQQRQATARRDTAGWTCVPRWPSWRPSPCAGPQSPSSPGRAWMGGCGRTVAGTETPTAAPSGWAGRPAT